MENRLKRKVAIGIVAVWVLLSGICFSEEFGYLQDHPEKASQAVEEALSQPADRVIYISDEQPGVPASTGLIGAAVVEFPQAERFFDSVSLVPVTHRNPNKLKLFQLLSIYRI